MFDLVYAPLDYLGFDRGERNLPDIPIDFSFASLEVDKEVGYKRGLYGHWLEAISPSDDLSNFDFGKADMQYQLLAEQETELRYRMNGVMGTWCSSEHGLFLKRFSAGESTAYQGALNNLPIVSAGVSWEEVRAFREDQEAVRKYRDLRLWLTDGLRAGSERHATDLIAQRIEDYRWAVKKHGLQTITGALSNLWDWRQSVTLVAGVGAAATFANAFVAALVAGVAITSGVGAYFAERKISEMDARHGAGREVAVLVDIQDRFGEATS